MSPRNFSRIALCLFLAACGTDDMTSTPAPEAFGGGTNDAFGARPGDPARVALLQTKAKDLIKPGSTLQVEPRLGVPTFLWAKPPLQKTSRMHWVTAGVSKPEVAAARGALATYAPLYGLSTADVTHAVVSHVDARTQGATIVKLRSQIGGIEVFREELTVILDRNLDAIAISGYLSSITTPPSRTGGMDFTLAPQNGAARVLATMANHAIDPALLAPVAHADGYEYFTLAANAGITLDQPVRVKRVYYRAPDGFEAAYYIEAMAFTGALPPDELSVDGNDKSLEAYAYVVSASTGQLLFRKNLIEHDVTYRVFADPVTRLPLDTPSGNAVHPKTNTSPDGAQFPFVAPSDVTLNSFPFSQNDPWLPPGATETVGNNVDAFVNLVNAAGNVDNGYGPVGAAVDPPTGDFRAQITGPDQFLHTNNPAGNQGLAEGRQGAIQQLFYNINFFHDWYYDAGFNELAGNAQTNNFGRGGVGNDSILGQAQDTSSFSNANMLTPADGGRPRMRMYNFPSPANHIEPTSPALGKLRIGISQTGSQARTDVTAEIIRATFSNAPTACTLTNAAALDGKIALFDFDNTDGVNCAFGTRITRIDTTNAVAVLMGYTAGNANAVASITGLNTTHTKPIAVISWNSRVLIQNQLTALVPVTAHLLRDHHFDGTVDNQIVAHEWMHYSTNRLVGNASGLGTNHASGMGEGWGDFNAMMITVRPDDTENPTNATWNGVYALATHALGGVPFDGVTPNNNFYFGIRRYPYSTDMTKNPLTFTHIQNGVALPVGPPVAFGANGAQNAEVHNTGEVWTAMLWECYAALLRDTQGPNPRLTFQQAQDRMKLYVIGGLKATPTFPTFTEARDGILAVALANDVNDYVAFRFAFAKRGAGSKAQSPDRFSADNIPVVEDFTVGPDLALQTAMLDDSLGACDTPDGVVDHGEYGKLTVTVRNTGTTVLVGTTATITTPSSGIWFPNGPTITFPSIAINGTQTGFVRIALPPTSTGIAQADFQISLNDPQLTAPVTNIASFRIDTDDIPASSATDAVETQATTWTPSAGTLPDIAPWARLPVTPLDIEWHGANAGAASDQRLTSPVFTVDGSGSVNVQFDHAWAFEFDASANYDGGVVEMSVNGGPFTDVGVGYNGVIVNYAGNLNPLITRNAYVKTGSAHTSITRAVAPGSTVQIRFRIGTDNAVGAAGWNVDNIAFTGVVETPFGTLVADPDACTNVPTSADLSITKTDGVASVTAGSTTTYTIVASNAGPGSIIGATVTDAIPSELTGCSWTCAGAGGATCGSPNGTGSIADQPTLPAGGSTTYTLGCTVSVSASSGTVVNTATVANPGPVTDPNGGNNAATDTDTLIHLPAHLFGSKTVTGTFTSGGTVTYSVILENDGTGIQFDNPGAEFTDVLPAGLSLVSASATSGTAGTSGSTVTWNGALPVGGTVTITITATITAAAGATISNQGTFAYDGDGNGTNELTGVTDAYPCN